MSTALPSADSLRAPGLPTTGADATPRAALRRARPRARLAEYIRYDATALRAPLAYAGLLGARALIALGQTNRGLRTLSSVHSTGFSSSANAAIASQLAGHLRGAATDETRLWRRFCQEYIASYGRDGSVSNALSDPVRMLGSRAIVLKSAREGERGVVVLGYSYVFPLFARLFDLPAVARRYHIVVEPSWCGLAAPEVLCLTQYDFPIFVEAWEPSDIEFLRAIDSNLLPVPIGDNWWVDHRLVAPQTGVAKDADVVMIAAWAAYKRHWRFFAALGRLRERGHRLKVLLIGYPVDLTQRDIAADAQAFGVLDQLEFHEGASVSEVARLMSRAKVHVLWSRREGANRAHVEAMFCNVPSVVREGFNFGFKQPHINEATGAYADEDTLGDTLLRLIERCETGSIRPRDWVLEHMTCQHATEILASAIRSTAIARGEAWTTGLAVKNVLLSRQQYWNPDDKQRFAPDYAFLESCIRR